MTRLNQDFTMFQGEKKLLQIPITDAAGAPVTLTGATVRWEVYLQRNDPELVKTTADLTNPITLINVDGTNDGIQIPLVPADTTGWLARTYKHECRVTDSSGNPVVVFTGKLTLRYSETKS